MDNFKCKPPCPGPDLPDFCPPPKPPTMCEPAPSVVAGMSLVETVQDLSNRLNTMCGVYNDVMANSYATLHNLQRAAQENGAYYGDCEVWTEEGYWADESAAYTLIHKACVDRRGDPIFMELHLAYGNTTNSQIKQGLFDASKITYADKMVTAVPVKKDVGWTGNAIWHGAPIASSPLPTGYTVGFTKSGVMRVYSNAVTVDQMLRDTVENAMGCPGVLIMNGQLTEDSWRVDIPLKDQQTERIVMGQNLDTREVIILTCGSENDVNIKGLTSAACAQILLQYGCDIAVELTEGKDAGATNQGSLMFVPQDNDVPATYAFWYISRKRFYTTDYERELAMLMQNYGQAIWNTYLNKNEIEKTQMELAAEVQARIEGDTNLNTKINEEIQRSTEADTSLTAALNTEREERIANDTSINNALQAEIQRSTEADTSLTAALNTEREERIANDTSINNALNEEVARAKAAETAETARASEAETSLTNALNTEREERIENDTSINNALNAEVLRAKTAEAQETARASEAETSLNNALKLEEQRRIQGDEALNTAINQETTRATTAENTLTTNLTNETERAKAAEAELHADVEKEIADRQKAVADEAQARIAADTTLQNNINTETAERQAAVAAEAQARAEADATLQNNINTETTERQAAVAAEAQARAEADSVLQANIDALATRVTALEGNVTTLKSLYDTLAKQTAAMDTTITAVQQTITSIEEALNNTKATIEDIRNGKIVLPYVRLSGDTMTGPLSIMPASKDKVPAFTAMGPEVTKTVAGSTYVTQTGVILYDAFSVQSQNSYPDGSTSDIIASIGNMGNTKTREFTTREQVFSITKDLSAVTIDGKEIRASNLDNDREYYSLNAGGLTLGNSEYQDGEITRFDQATNDAMPLTVRTSKLRLTNVPASQGPGEPVVISGVADPTNPTDAVNKQTLDAAVAAGVTPATTTTLGGIIVGDNLTVETNGRLSAVAGSYTLPAATADTLGGVKVGQNLTVTADGTLNATGGYTPTDASKTAKGVVQVGEGINVADGVISSPVATQTAPGLVKPGSNLTVTADGTLNAPAPGISKATADATYLPQAGGTITGNIVGTDVGLVSPGAASGLTVSTTGAKLSGQSVSLSNSPSDTIPVKLQNVAAPTNPLDAVNLATMQAAVAGVPEYKLPTASASQVGGVKIGSNISVAGDGTISTHAPYTLPTASTTQLGGVKVGTNINAAADGTISVPLISNTAAGVIEKPGDYSGLEITQGKTLRITDDVWSRNLIYEMSSNNDKGILMGSQKTAGKGVVMRPPEGTLLGVEITNATYDDSPTGANLTVTGENSLQIVNHPIAGMGNAIISSANGTYQDLQLLANTINVSSSRITGVGTPTQPADAATKAYVDGKASGSGITQAQADARYLKLSGGTLTGNLIMSSSRITQVGNPTQASDAATKAYVDFVTGEGFSTEKQDVNEGYIISSNGTQTLTTFSGSITCTLNKNISFFSINIYAQNGITIPAGAYLKLERPTFTTIKQRGAIGILSVWITRDTSVNASSRFTTGFTRLSVSEFGDLSASISFNGQATTFYNINGVIGL